VALTADPVAANDLSGARRFHSVVIPPAVPPHTGLVILAAGASRRLGQPKQLLAVSGVPLLSRAIEAALAVPAVWPVVVVLGAHAELIRPLAARRPVLVADNPAWAEGMASSLRVGLDTLLTFAPRLEAAIFALCDQPAFSSAVIERLLAERAATGASVVAARYAGHLGAPALITKRHFPVLTQLVGDEGARQLFARLPPEDLAGVDCPELAFDLDTPADLQQLDPPA
jgi:molybdenum cofactor cytidylyltransferase